MLAYVGTFTQWDDQPSEGIYGFACDPDDGTLEPVTVEPLPNPSFLALADGVLYAATHTSHFEGEPGCGLVSYAVADGGALRRTASVRLPSTHAVHVSLAGADVLVACGLGGAVCAVAGGAVTAVAQLDGAPTVPLGAASTLPTWPAAGAPHPHCAVASPDGRFVLVPNLNQGRIHVLRRDGLRRHAEVAAPWPRHLAFHPSGRALYVNDERGSRVGAYAWEDGSLRRLASAPTAPEAVANTTADVHVAGRFLYVSNRGHDSLAVLELQDDLTPRLIANVPTGAGPRGFVIAGSLLLCANQGSGDVWAYRLGDDGIPVHTGARTRVPCAVCVRVK